MKITKWRFSYIVEIDAEGPVSWKLLPPVQIDEDEEEEENEPK